MVKVMLDTFLMIGIFKTDTGIKVAVTNTSKETVYINQPSFVFSVPPDDGCDSFYIQPEFIKPIESGAQISVDYIITKDIDERCKQVLEKDANTTIKAIVTTSNKENFESEPIRVSELVKHNTEDPFDYIGN